MLELGGRSIGLSGSGARDLSRVTLGAKLSDARTQRIPGRNSNRILPTLEIPSMQLHILQ